MKPLGGDWTAFIFVAVMGAIALLGGRFLGGYALGHATSTTEAQVAVTATPQPTPGCWFGDFPYYSGSLAVAASSPGAEAWHVNQAAATVAGYFANGASQFAWQFQLSSQTASRWNFRMTRAPACRGSFTVLADPAGGILFEAVPDSQ